MTIATKTKFYYGYTIDSTNFYLNFSEGGLELTAQVTPSGYTLTTLADAIATALNETGTQEYSVSVDRESRTYTISADSNFELLVNSGSNLGFSIYSTIGFTNGDLTGSNTYTSNVSTGFVFTPQFFLQDFLGPDDFQGFAESKVNKSASGTVEVYSLGSEAFYEFNIKYQNNYPQPKNSLISFDENGVENLRAFMQFAITKSPLEIMEDLNDSSTYKTILLESGQGSPNGTSYRLRDLFSRGLNNWYETGRLKWRLQQ